MDILKNLGACLEVAIRVNKLYLQTSSHPWLWGSLLLNLLRHILHDSFIFFLEGIQIDGRALR